MDKIGEALGPWPILQLCFGMAVLGVGVYALVKGLASSRPHGSRDELEDARQEWETLQHLKQIAYNTKQVAENQKVMLDRVNAATEQIKALAAAIWNRGIQ